MWGQVVETISWYQNNGSKVFTCAMDLTKSFDLTLHSLLFKMMLKAGCPVIFIYIHQTTNVRWNEELLSVFPMTNGVRPGAVLSAISYWFCCEIYFHCCSKEEQVAGFLAGTMGIYVTVMTTGCWYPPSMPYRTYSAPARNMLLVITLHFLLTKTLINARQN